MVDSTSNRSTDLTSSRRSLTRPDRSAPPSRRLPLLRSGPPGESWSRSRALASASDRSPQHAEASLFYDPPYPTPLDDAVAWHLVKYLRPTHGLQSAVSGPALGRFSTRLDMMVEVFGQARRVGLVYTPAATDLAERLHDGLLIGAGAVDALYRVRRADLAYHLHDVLWLWAQWEPALFSDRGRTNLATLVSSTARAAQPGPAEVECSFSCPTAEDGDTAKPLRAVLDVDLPAPPEVALRRRLRARPDTWQADHEAACTHFQPSTPRAA